MLVFILDSKNIAAAKKTERSVQSAIPDCSCVLIEFNYAMQMNQILAGYNEPFFLAFFAGEQLEPGFQNQLEHWISCISDHDAGIVIDTEANPSRGPFLWQTRAVKSGAFPGFRTAELLPFERYVLLDKQYELEGIWEFKLRKSDKWLPKPKSNEGWRKLGSEEKFILPILQTKHDNEPSAIRPYITVVICSFNNADYLLWAVRSVCKQSYQAWELMIVDDGSTDGTHEKWLASPFSSHSGIRFIRNETNKGKAFCLNQALSAANGKWLLELDSDDWLDTACLQTLVDQSAISPEAGMIYADHMNWHERRDKSLILNVPQYDQSQMTVDKLLRDALPLAPRMYSMQAISALGGWSVDDPFQGRLYEDFQMLARIMLCRPVSYIPKALYHRRIRSSSVTHRHPDCYKTWTRWMLDFIRPE
ncbi:glycosyltransferase family 2 protein [Paenibacillus harenae]|uniref:Glycosyltransferase 2-like domain-containing protein n=1 Tax=Paenibacillus harenae TaxID=306543 RepID=A0ABT9TXY1_PAEHA|nr:glycosyltransferase family 2 protein [Paenibacillus harenae]MDQ0112216.1 hypothetical protein [Paenibacillus harenae]